MSSATPPPLPPTASPPSPAVRRARRWRIVVLTVLVVLGVPLVTVCVLLALWRSEPAYWQRNRQRIAAAAPEDLLQAADSLQQRVLNEASHVNPDPAATAQGELRTIHIAAADANAWLASRLGDWLANQNAQLPPEISQPMIAVDGDDLVLAFRITTPQIDQVVSVGLTAQPSPSGRLLVRATKVHLGSLRIPVETLVQNLRRSIDAETGHKLQQVMSLFNGQEIEWTRRLDDMRRLRLVSIAPKDDGLDVAVRIEQREPRDARPPRNGHPRTRPAGPSTAPGT